LQKHPFKVRRIGPIFDSSVKQGFVSLHRPRYFGPSYLTSFLDQKTVLQGRSSPLQAKPNLNKPNAALRIPGNIGKLTEDNHCGDHSL
jgi:hypothetical protein